MKKICIITPSLSQGGLENAVTVVANEMAQKDYDVTIICAYNQEVFYKLDEKIKIISPPYKRRNFSKTYYYWKTIKYFREYIKLLNPDVVISYGDYINFISIIATKGLKIPIYVSDRSSPEKKLPFLVEKLRKLTYPKADGVIAQTERAKKQKLKMLDNKGNIKVIPNPVRSIQEYNNVKKENIILAVARHYYVKGLDRLLEAFSQINKEGWKLVVAGNFGPETENLKAQVKLLGIERSVVFLGAVKEIDEVYAKAKVFVLPSRSEGFPNALIEAMAHGLACISFDITAGPADVITNDETGILVADGDIEELAKQIQSLMENEDKRIKLGKNSRYIKDDLRVTNVVEAIIEFTSKNTV